MNTYRERKNASIVSAVVIVAIFAVLATAQFYAPPPLTFSLFYLIPVGLAAWCFEKQQALFSSLVALIFILGVRMTKPGSPALSFQYYWEVLSSLMVMLGAVYVVNALRDSLLREQRLSKTDRLTGVATSRYLFEMIDYEIQKAGRFGYPLSLISITLEGFNAVHDTMGHQTGDTLLSAMADIMKRSVRTVDLVGRLAGDEFAVLLPGGGMYQARGVAQRMRGNLADVVRENNWGITFSMGAVTHLAPTGSAQGLVGTAERLMHTARNNGKNSFLHEVVGHSPEEESLRKIDVLRETELIGK